MREATPRGLLQYDPERMREIGYRTIDALIDAAARADSEPILRKVSAVEMRRRLEAPPPELGTPYEQVLQRVFADVVPFRGRTDAGGYMAFIPGFPTWPSAMADLLASALQLDCCWWAGGAGPSQLELTVLGWFADWIGYPREASGVLVSGGSAANLTALACARERLVGSMRDDLVVYVSSQSHSSVARAARALGFRPERVRVLPVDRAFRMRVDVFERALAADRAAGLVPLAVCANAGTTNTGAVDPLGHLADLCSAHGLWLHVDGAYGGFAALTERGRQALAGIERADSVTLDPHKWLFQPFECGALLVRDPDGLRSAFEITPDYLRDVSAREEVNFSDRGLQLTRMTRSLKVWMSVQNFGLAAFRAAIDGALDLARDAAARIEVSEELELLAPVDLSVVAFRRRPAGVSDERELDALNSALVTAVEESGDVYLSSTRLFGRSAIRLCVLNPTTAAAHVHRALDLVESIPVAALRVGGERPVQRESDLAAGWLTRPTVGAGDVGHVPLLAAMEPDSVAALLRNASERRVHPGETLIEQWDTSRDFFVVLDGTFRVFDGDQVVGVVEVEDFVGELAALDWGAGYGAIRMARVEALTHGTVLVVSPAHLRDALVECAAARDLVERTARDRLAAVG